MIASALHTAADIDLIHLAFDGIFIVKHTPPPVGSEVMRRACRSLCFSDKSVCSLASLRNCTPKLDLGPYLQNICR